MGKNASRNIGIVVGVLLCVVSVPVIIFNLFFIIQGFVSPDKAPSLSGKTPLIVLTESMNPIIKGGDLVICDAIDANDVNQGDVISFFDPTMGETNVIVTHRVEEISTKGDEIYFKTKGDANNISDKNMVSQSKLVGKWNGFRIAGLGNFCMWLKSVPGIVVCVGIPLLLLIGYDIIRRKTYTKRQQQTEAQLRSELESLKSQVQTEQSSAPNSQFINTTNNKFGSY